VNIRKWLEGNTESLAGKTVAVTGATGGIGTELCRHLAALGAALILLDRNPEKSHALGARLQAEVPGVQVRYIRLDLADMASVEDACRALEATPVDVLIHNAGIYSVPRYVTEAGYDNVFQVNFVSPYYMTRRLLPHLGEQPGARVVAVGSIAHNYSVSDPGDIDFRTRRRASLVYGNAKRYLMVALDALFRHERAVSLSICHPGITYTNITAHYPKVIFALIKHPMKVLFMKPRKASLCILRGIFEECGENEWIGPRICSVWGLPRKRRLRTYTEAEEARIFETAERIYAALTERGERG
jgi:NAD(P)-dependent dehydrogenase (short-subunit alcohol dehydrogenase family)